ncbi:AraC family transcriptional regulator [Wenyingzhuangia sp. 2_MG-2023]|uniref:helix-turn-helix domain-containing protein n=1 Tax=Wenyingzhuangia sp. 2_MG-2023 TaxID=3062639 RepID=UPI0026E200FC|nr:helix-turn-helix transcriptional regulator [Wenyingzhuangia sp. 2_MG-2023]MDO6739244.1 helix-turn-helix transcriptional regulator [Wenyingzhuangia sp. 2_MG-2023]
MKDFPVYDIQKFNCNISKNDLYINTFKIHLVSHSFIENSHRHNFYLLVVFTHGNGTHQIDLNTYSIEPRSVFVIQPGQAHHWKLSKDIEGYIVFFTQEIYNLYFGTKKIEEYPFYSSTTSTPKILLNENEWLDLEPYFQKLIQENLRKKSRKKDKILNLLDLIHIELSRNYLSENAHNFQSYNHKIELFNDLLDKHYKTQKAPSFYASKMNITLKHLNRICKETLNKTVTELIAQRIILESKRMLTFSPKTISEVAESLGYYNYSYFTKVFTKHTGLSPTKFRKNLGTIH